MTGGKLCVKKPIGRDRILFNILSYVILTVLSAACLLPFLLVLSGSVSEQYSIQLHGYRLFPESISLVAYQMLFRIPEELLRAYGVTILVTAVGTIVGLWLTSMAAYVLSNHDFRYRYQASFFFYFTSVF
ncbi:MAG: carbohydrate ABC transporter permease, partial [Oscillospiraceae bacterium]